MKKDGKNFSLSDFHIIGYRLFGNAPTKILPKSNLFKASLEKAGMKISFSVYISSMFFWSIVVTVLTSATSLYIGLPSSLTLPIEFVAHPLTLNQPAISVLIGGIAGIVIIIMFYAYPKYVAGQIKREIEKNLVYITNYMTIMSNAGATPEETFASLAKNGEVYGINESARSVMRDLEFFGQDIITAIDEESQRTPSKEYRDFLQGFISTIRVGGDLKYYLASMTEKFIEDRRRLLAKIISHLNLAAELYTVSLVAFPIIMIVLFMIMGFFGGEVLGKLTPMHVMSIMTYVLLPLSTVGLIILLDSLLASW